MLTTRTTPFTVPTPARIALLAQLKIDTAMEAANNLILQEMAARMEALAISPTSATYRYTILGHRFPRYDIQAIEIAMRQAGWHLTWQQEKRPNGNADLQWTAIE